MRAGFIVACALAQLVSIPRHASAGKNDGPFDLGEDDLVAVLANMPPRRDSQALVSLRSVRIWRTTEEPWVELSPKDVREGRYQPGAEEDYAVAGLLTCHQVGGNVRWSNEKVTWFLLRGNRLVAYDFYHIGEACSFRNQFRPAQGVTVAQERALSERIRKRYPRGMLSVSEQLEKGIVLAEVCRIEDARQRLQQADRGLDIMEPDERTMGSADSDPGRAVEIRGDSGERSLRQRLVEAIERGCAG